MRERSFFFIYSLVESFFSDHHKISSSPFNFSFSYSISPFSVRCVVVVVVIAYSFPAAVALMHARLYQIKICCSDDDDALIRTIEQSVLLPTSFLLLLLTKDHTSGVRVHHIFFVKYHRSLPLPSKTFF